MLNRIRNKQELKIVESHLENLSNQLAKLRIADYNDPDQYKAYSDWLTAMCSQLEQEINTYEGKLA